MSRVPSWLTEGCSEVRKQQIERDWQARDERHRRSMRVTARVVDVSDETLFPEIAAACEWVRSRRIANDER